MTRLLSALLVLACLCGTTVPLVSAQTPAVPSDKLGWTQAASAQEIGELTYAVFVDGTRQPLTGSACVLVAAGSYACQAPFPAMTPGNHTIELVAIRTIGTTVLESLKSAPFSVQFVVVPSTPTDLKVVKG